ncbi:hypothetical protein DFH29DRAFT_1081735 [Suillus ampliporus]|nr:hypothetical protein DFH29DRAFT_1081735 [Suillus ampliporus]
MFELLQDIVNILKTSSIAEERGKGVRSKFWAAYKESVWLGLFSAVNTAFIIAMQPNPLDTTNRSSRPAHPDHGQRYLCPAQPAIISSITSYSSSNFWMQALAYMSLALSLITHRFGSGSLEQRCKQRHRKFKGIEKWRFEDLLESLADLLKGSLFLFALSLAAWMWKQQQTISILIISATAFGFVFYVATILAAVVDPNCPFQTRLSSAFHHLLFQTRRSRAFHRILSEMRQYLAYHRFPFVRRLFSFSRNLQKREEPISSPMAWMLSISTNPDAVSAAFELMANMSQTSSIPNSQSLCYTMRAMFMNCFNEEGKILVEDDALTYGKSLIQVSKNATNMSDILLHNTEAQGMNFWTLWHTLYLRQALDVCQRSHVRMKEGDEDAKVRSLCQADIRTALRMVVPTGADGFADPDGQSWDGKFGQGLDLPDVHWLMDIATQFLATQDLEAAGDALMLLSGVLKNPSFLTQDDIIRYLNSTHDQSHQTHVSYARWCRIVLHAAYGVLDNNRDLSCHDPLSQAVLKSICPPVDRDHDQDQFSDAIKLLNFTQWDHGTRLASSPLPSIQLLVLRVLPAPKVDTLERFVAYCRALVHHMDEYQPVELHHAALRAACGVTQDLPMIAADGELRDIVSELSRALLTVVHPHHIDADYDIYYLRLIFVLAGSPAWLRRSDEDVHIKRCIRIIPEFHDRPPPSFFYLAGIFLRIKVAHSGRPAPQLATIDGEEWWDLTRMAWHVAGRPNDQEHDRPDCDVLDDGIDIVKALVTVTEMFMPQDAPTNELEFLRDGLGDTLKKLGSQQSPVDESIVSAVRGLKDVVDRRLNPQG